MRKKYIILFVFLHSLGILFGQLYTKNGFYISPKDTLHVLAIFINVVFDECPECDPLFGEQTPFWVPGDTSVLNSNPPVYLEDFLDTEFDPNNIRGSFTKFYADASFNNFLILGDFVTVNIPQSYITPEIINDHFQKTELSRSVVRYINQKGGLITEFGNNNINYFDGYINSPINPREIFRTKMVNKRNDSIDFSYFILRNGNDDYGNVNEGGTTGACGLGKDTLLIDSNYYHFDYQNDVYIGTKAKDLSRIRRIPTEVHELAHQLFSISNSIHMGGGAPLTTGDRTTLTYNKVWSIIGGYSALTSCSAYDRWRLDWRGPSNNAFPIAASNIDSDIEKADGSKIFYLRDFMSFGDAVRIRLPYVDEGALNQYIWLEYHNIHGNNKIDYPYEFDSPCKDFGRPGVFAYYQVGKDILESSESSDLIPFYTDNLIPICADGQWDVRRLPDSGVVCMNGNKSNIQEYYQENPFCGYNDLKSHHFFNTDPVDILNYETCGITDNLIKIQNGITTNKTQSLGDDEDPFISNLRTRHFNLSSNPAPVNVITYYHKARNNGVIEKSSRTDNRKIHLSGLGISMKYMKDLGAYKIIVNWNDYTIGGTKRWTGDIVLHEQLNLHLGCSLILDQNQTPDKHIRDSRTGLFSGPTYFTCLPNTLFTMAQESSVDLKNMSSYILNGGADLEIGDDAVFHVEEGTTLLLKANSNLTISGTGKVEVETGGCLCIENGANITLQDASSQIYLHTDATNGVNPVPLPETYDCRYNLASTPFSGSGHMNIQINPVDKYIQNETIYNKRTYSGRNIFFGEKVTTTKSFGPAKLNSGANVTATASGAILIEPGFEAVLGSQLTLQVN